jgi:hypothetical protein
MANNSDRRALIVKAVATWRQFQECLIGLGGSTGSAGVDRFMAVSSDKWGQGAWMLYTELNGYRYVAESIMGFRLGLEDLDTFADNPKAPLRLYNR